MRQIFHIILPAYLQALTSIRRMGGMTFARRLRALHRHHRDARYQTNIGNLFSVLTPPNHP